MSTITDRVAELVLPIAAEAGASLYDVEHQGSTVRVLIDSEGGVDLATVTAVTRALSAALDSTELLTGAYTLEVSSPGVERSLRTPEHFSRAVGQQVRVKLRPGVEGDRRFTGELIAADDTAVTIRDSGGEDHLVRLADISKANVHVDWSPPPKPGSAGASGSTRKQSGTKSPSRNQSEATP